MFNIINFLIDFTNIYFIKLNDYFLHYVWLCILENLILARTWILDIEIDKDLYMYITGIKF